MELNKTEIESNLAIQVEDKLNCQQSKTNSRSQNQYISSVRTRQQTKLLLRDSSDQSLGYLNTTENQQLGFMSGQKKINQTVKKQSKSQLTSVKKNLGSDSKVIESDKKNQIEIQATQFQTQQGQNPGELQLIQQEPVEQQQINNPLLFNQITTIVQVDDFEQKQVNSKLSGNFIQLLSPEQQQFKKQESNQDVEQSSFLNELKYDQKNQQKLIQFPEQTPLFQKQQQQLTYKDEKQIEMKNKQKKEVKILQIIQFQPEEVKKEYEEVKIKSQQEIEIEQSVHSEIQKSDDKLNQIQDIKSDINFQEIIEAQNRQLQFNYQLNQIESKILQKSIEIGQLNQENKQSQNGDKIQQIEIDKVNNSLQFNPIHMGEEIKLENLKEGDQNGKEFLQEQSNFVLIENTEALQESFSIKDQPIESQSQIMKSQNIDLRNIDQIAISEQDGQKLDKKQNLSVKKKIKQNSQKQNTKQMKTVKNTGEKLIAYNNDVLDHQYPLTQKQVLMENKEFKQIQIKGDCLDQQEFLKTNTNSIVKTLEIMIDNIIDQKTPFLLKKNKKKTLKYSKSTIMQTGNILVDNKQKKIKKNE